MKKPWNHKHIQSLTKHATASGYASTHLDSCFELFLCILKENLSNEEKYLIRLSKLRKLKGYNYKKAKLWCEARIKTLKQIIADGELCFSSTAVMTNQLNKTNIHYKELSSHKLWPSKYLFSKKYYIVTEHKTLEGEVVHSYKIKPKYKKLVKDYEKLERKYHKYDTYLRKKAYHRMIAGLKMLEP